MISSPNKTKFALQMLWYQWRLRTIFDASHSWNMSLQSHLFSFFFMHTCKNCQPIIWLPSNSVHIKRYKKALNTSNIDRVIKYVSNKMTPICCRTYRANHLSQKMKIGKWIAEPSNLKPFGVWFGKNSTDITGITDVSATALLNF